MKRLLEICCADADSIDAAIKGGTDRIELCSALSVGGLTPSKGLIDYACSQTGIPVNVLIRPRPGDFVFSGAEIEIMLTDIRQAAASGASGVVIGALLQDGSVDYDACSRLVDCARSVGLSVTFHRAFDVCSDPIAGLQTVISLGCDRLLTSGQAEDALSGADMISRLMAESAGRLIILAGAGITPANAAALIERTGVTELHGSAKISLPDRTVTSSEIVSQLSQIIRSTL